MPTNALSRAADATARLEIHQVAKYLTDHLGSTLTAAMANGLSGDMACRWAIAPGELNHSAPRAGEARRLRAAHTVAVAIGNEYGDEIPRVWFLAGNLRLRTLPPADLIRQGDLGGAFAAALTFLEHTDSGSPRGRPTRTQPPPGRPIHKSGSCNSVNNEADIPGAVLNAPDALFLMRRVVGPRRRPSHARPRRRAGSKTHRSRDATGTPSTARTRAGPARRAPA
jgi:hypothetical protein